jgi:zinc protease
MNASLQAQEGQSILDIQTHTTPSGIDYMVVQDTNLPIVTINFSFRGAGSINDPVGKDGLGQLVSNVMDEGAGDRDAHEFQKALQDRAIELSFYNSRDHFGGSLKTLKRHLPIATELLRDALMHPLFEEEAIIRMRNANMARIKTSTANPDWQAARLMNAVYFGDHAYARNSGGTLSGLESITADDMRRFVSDYLTKDRLEIAFAGDITVDETSVLADKIFSSLPKDGNEIQKLQDVKVLTKNKIVAFQSDSPQTVAIMVWPIFEKTDPDYYALRVFNHILGAGGFSSMLMDRVREQQGLTYGIYSRLSHIDYVNYLSIESSTSPENIQKMTVSIQEILNELKTKTVSEKTLAEAKSYLIGSMPLQFSSTQRLSSTPISLAMDDLPMTYLDDWASEIANVTVNDIQRLANRIFKDEQPKLTVLAGAIPDDQSATIIETLPGVE